MTVRRLRVPAACLLLLVPVFWQPRIQSVDLPSHIYNAWLTLLVEKGQAPGLAIAPQWTNTLFDILLVELLRKFGPDAAQRIAVALAVLIFNTGLFLLLSRPRRGYPWALFPIQAMLSYGWVYQIGILNYYLAFGLACIALSLLVEATTARRSALAVLLLFVAFLAHALPTFWAAGIGVHCQVARRLGAKGRLLWTAFGVLVILGVVWFLRAHFASMRYPPDAMSLIGADQIMVFQPAYAILALALLVVWVLQLAQLLDRVHPVRALLSPLAQATFLSAVSVASVPVMIMLPGYHQSLALLQERISLNSAVLILAWFSTREVPKWLAPVGLILATMFFAGVYRDTAWLNRVEDGITLAARQLPKRARVVSGFRLQRWRLDPCMHQLDRACLGWCYSYGDYEPSTFQFRLRAVAENPIVMSSQKDKADLEQGHYIVKELDLPLYQLVLLNREKLEFAAKPLAAGERVALTPLDGSPDSTPNAHKD